jgi:hypothetical protein
MVVDLNEKYFYLYGELKSVWLCRGYVINNAGNSRERQIIQNEKDKQN